MRCSWQSRTTDLEEVAINLATLDFMESVRDPAMFLGQETADALARAFGVSAQMFINLDNSYRLWLKKNPERNTTERIASAQ